MSDDQPRAGVVEGQGRGWRRRDVEAVDVNAAVLILEMAVLIDHLKVNSYENITLLITLNTSFEKLKLQVKGYKLQV